MSGILESLGSLFSPLGTKVGLKNMFERCLAARTKSEEKFLVQDCLQIVKLKLSEPSLKGHITTKCLLFSIFSEMLGYRADFAYIHAANLAQQGTLIEKKVGYLACAVLLRPSDEVSVLLVNTIVRDLTNKNIAIISMALTACCHLLLIDQLPTLMPLVVEKLNHSNEYVRSKAVIVMHHFLRLCPEHCCHYTKQVQCLLGDKDPGVVSLVLQYLLNVAQSSPNTLNDIVPSLVQIQRQILDGKLPPDFNYRGMRAPWIQVSILRLLHCSGISNPDVQNIVYETLIAARNHTNGEEVQGAIICECIVTLSKIATDENRLTSSIELVSQFLSSNNINLRYEGLNVLEHFLHHSPVSLTPHLQGVVMETLQHTDSSMKRKALSLLCSAAIESNARKVCTHVADYALTDCANNPYLRSEMVNKILLLIDKYPDFQNYWHVAMLLRLLPLAEGKQNEVILTKFKLALLAGNDDAHRTSARQKVLKLLHKYSESKTVCTSVLEAHVWSLGRFFDINVEEGTAEDAATKSLTEICELGLKVIKNVRKEPENPQQVANLLVSIVQAAAHTAENSGISVEILPELLHKISSSSIPHALLTDCCSELLQTLPHLEAVHKVLKNSSVFTDSLENKSKFDFTLSFLDEFVCESLDRGEEPYLPKADVMHQPPSTFPHSTSVHSQLVASSPSLSVLPNPTSPSSGSESLSELPTSTSSRTEDSKPWLLLSEGTTTPTLLWTSKGRINKNSETQEHVDKASAEVNDTSVLTDLSFDRKKETNMGGQNEVTPFVDTSQHDDLFEEMLGENLQKLSVLVPSEKT